MIQLRNSLLFLVIATTGNNVVSSSMITPWFLRGSSSTAMADPSASAKQTRSIVTPYDDLIACMWNGTTVATCHAMGCKWCHASFSDICVTDEYATQLNGTVFHCEGGGHSTDDDDDAVVPPATDDDHVVPPPPPPATPAPVTPAPTTVAPVVTTDDDGVEPITDDDPNHDANEIYMKRLLHCMAIGRGDTCDADAICTWCTHGSASPAPGMCFSKQAAKEMSGAYYTCKVEENDNNNNNNNNNNNEDYDNVGIATATTNRHDKGANHVEMAVAVE